MPRPGTVVDLVHPLVLLAIITFLPHNLWTWIQIPLYLVFFKFFWLWCGFVAEMKKEVGKEEVGLSSDTMIVMVMVTPRPPSSLTLVFAKEGRGICCTRGKLSGRARWKRRRRWVKKVEGGRRWFRRVEEEEGEAKGRRRRIVRLSCGLENLRLYLPRQGCFLQCQDQGSSEVPYIRGTIPVS